LLGRGKATAKQSEEEEELDYTARGGATKQKDMIVMGMRHLTNFNIL